MKKIKEKIILYLYWIIAGLIANNSDFTLVLVGKKDINTFNEKFSKLKGIVVTDNLEKYNTNATGDVKFEELN